MSSNRCELWEGLVPTSFWEEAAAFSGRPGGFDPKARVEEMEVDSVSAGPVPIAGHEAIRRSSQIQSPASSDTTIGYPIIARPRRSPLHRHRHVGSYDIDGALAETRRCAGLGLRGVQIWQVRPTTCPDSGHLRAAVGACGELGLPVNLHILTGFGYSEEVHRQPGTIANTGDLAFKLAINRKLHAVMDGITEILLSGALDRHRDLKLIIVENEVAWLPFFIDQLDDYYVQRFGDKSPIQLARKPSDIFRDQIFATFFRDPNAAAAAAVFDNLIWSATIPYST